jgi:hypothetical protein
MKKQTKLDEAIAAYVYEGLRIGEPPKAGDTVSGIDVRHGNEGPNSWTRYRQLTIEQRHIDMARSWAR